jgi:hypothetical protein
MRARGKMEYFARWSVHRYRFSPFYSLRIGASSIEWPALIHIAQRTSFSVGTTTLGFGSDFCGYKRNKKSEGHN